MAIYHLTAKTGTRERGQSATAKIDYLRRGGKYERGGDEVVHVDSINMPEWATRDCRRDTTRAAARDYWRAADEHERANGRLYKHIEFALPRELSTDENKALATRFAAYASTHGVEGGKLPCTLTMHKGRNEGRGRFGDNPHADIVISERINDGIERSAETWFARAASSTKGKKVDPAKGGAKKTDALKSEEWLLHMREVWAQFQNEALAKAGHDVRVDHRTLDAQGIDREPEKHLGPQAIGYEERTGEKSNRRIWHEEQAAAVALRDELAEAQASYAQMQEAAKIIEKAKQAAPVGLLKILSAPPSPKPKPNKRPTKNGAFDPARTRWMEYRKKVQEQNYGNSSEWLAQFWRVDREPPKVDAILKYENANGTVRDRGSVMHAANGNDDEIECMIELAELKKWNSIQFTGSDDFKLRAMVKTLKTSEMQVSAATPHDNELLEKAKAIAAADPKSKYKKKI